MFAVRGFYLLLLLFVSVAYFVPTHFMDKELMTFYLISVGVIFTVFYFIKEKNHNLRGQLIKHSSLFLLGFVIVHFQYYLDFVLGNASVNEKIIWYRNDVVLKSFCLSIAGLLSFLLGYLHVRKHKIKKVTATLFSENYSTVILQVLMLFFLIAFYLTVDPRYLLGNYGSVELSPAANYAQFGFMVMIFACIIQNVRNAYSKALIRNFKDYVKMQGIPLSMMIGVYLLSVLFSGDRGPLMTVSLAYLAGYLFLTKNKFNKYAIILVLFVGATFITLLGQVRKMDKDISFSNRLVEAYNNEGVNGYSTQESSSSISPQTKELASSVRTLHMAVAYIPESHDFMYGRFQLQHVLGTIPFGTEFKNLIFEETPYKYTGSGQFVTWIDQGDNRFYGLGTTCITDFYFDLGLLGVIIGMFFFGIMIRNAELAMYNSGMPNLLIHIIAFVYLAFSIYISRSSVLFNLKMCMFIYLVLIANKYLVNYKKIQS